MSTTPEVTEAGATIQTDDGPMAAHVAVPANTPKGGVVVLQEAFGVTPHIRDVARRFARAGWHAVAPALFHRQATTEFAHDDLQSAMRTMQTLTAEGLTTDLLAAIGQFESSGIPAERIALVGFCMGGTVAFYGATARPLGAAVTFYGGGVAQGRFGLPSLVDLAPDLETPWLGLYGDQDQSIAVDDVELLRQAVAKAPVDAEIVRYAGAGHGFHNDARPQAYAPDAARDAWSRAIVWLDRYAAAAQPVT